MFVELVRVRVVAVLRDEHDPRAQVGGDDLSSAAQLLRELAMGVLNARFCFLSGLLETIGRAVGGRGLFAEERHRAVCSRRRLAELAEQLRRGLLLITSRERVELMDDGHDGTLGRQRLRKRAAQSDSWQRIIIARLRSGIEELTEPAGWRPRIRAGRVPDL